MTRDYLRVYLPSQHQDSPKTEKAYEDGLTIRYEVRENGVYKQVGRENDYHKVTGEELENFRNATKAYLRLVKSRIYSK